MWKKPKQNKTKLEKETTKFSVITAAISATALTIIVVSAIYIYIKNWTPIKDFSAKRINGGATLNIEFSTKTPVTGYVLYGTHPLATNRKEIEGEIFGKTSMRISAVLPNKKHFVKFVTQTTDGRTFETDFLEIK